ncbi:hypothetical protein EIN_197870 [Entamoeba invadens IP1]|uniref:Uncharacterized protein n=1 Tax=Entamoeba invadens IP1 TaxID=370355 RepID=A0A0A1TUT8_ENTIV|nr:hypothetical protein EIN_197870 [Entamoeba invadens IP1]ELP83844.1 hypothetical protein EIN_197870 [Entamoeba invadens IP1]|eukprot:XP_004183190.1 hypothetical protein EIN_197870 [Entamoeba invadens IP1]
MIAFIERRRVGNPIIFPRISPLYSLNKLQGSDFLKDGGVLLGYNPMGDSIGYSCTQVPTLNETVRYNFSLIFSKFEPPLRLDFHSLPILPLLDLTPSLPLHILFENVNNNNVVVYHYSNNTLHLSILSLSKNSFPAHFSLSQVTQPFSVFILKNSVKVISSRHIITIRFTCQPLQDCECITASQNVVSLNVNVTTRCIKVTGLLFDTTPITFISIETPPPYHAILPFMTTRFEYYTLSLNNNAVLVSHFFNGTPTPQVIHSTHFNTLSESQITFKQMLLDHYKTEKIIHPLRYIYSLSNASTFTNTTVDVIRHPLGLATLTF